MTQLRQAPVRAATTTPPLMKYNLKRQGSDARIYSTQRGRPTTRLSWLYAGLDWNVKVQRSSNQGGKRFTSQRSRRERTPSSEGRFDQVKAVSIYRLDGGLRADKGAGVERTIDTGMRRTARGGGGGGSLLFGVELVSPLSQYTPPLWPSG